MKSRLLPAAAFLSTIPLANWLIGNVGTVCLPQGPCLVPVAPGLMAPSGVLAVGAALVLRDWLHEVAGVRWVFAALAAGCLISAAVAPPSLVVASAVAFLLAELADLAIYAPLRRRRLWLAVLLSGIAGSVVDSALFLTLAFGSLDFIIGNVVGKLWATLAAVPAIGLARAARA